MKNILITSGGTIVKIDDVRYIGNFSSGKFLSQIAEKALSANHAVFYLHAKKAKLPFQDDFIFQPDKPIKPQFEKFIALKKKYAGISKKLFLFQFETFDDYRRLLKKILKKHSIDIIFLGAAVSDYGMKQRKGKISSSKNNLNISLTRNSKVISMVKKWTRKPIFQVGFKLLSGTPENKLKEAAYKSGLINKSDITIANDLEKIRKGKRNVILITPEGGAIKMTEPDLAGKVFRFINKRADVLHFKSIIKQNLNLGKIYKKEIQLISEASRQLAKTEIMPPFFKGSSQSHGSIALRTKNNYFIINARKSSKNSVSPKNLVLIKKVDWQNKKIICEAINDSTRPSFNTVLAEAIFKKFSKINAVVHTHNTIKDFPETSFPYTPGTIEYINEPLKLLNKNRLINLKDHGLISIGENLNETVNYVIKKSKN